MGNTDEKLISNILADDIEVYAILVKPYQKAHIQSHDAHYILRRGCV